MSDLATTATSYTVRDLFQRAFNIYGPRIAVTAENQPGKPLRQIDELRSGGSYYSQNDLRLHFGLDAAVRADLVEIAWPSGAKDQFKNLQANHL